MSILGSWLGMGRGRQWLVWVWRSMGWTGDGCMKLGLEQRQEDTILTKLYRNLCGS